MGSAGRQLRRDCPCHLLTLGRCAASRALGQLSGQGRDPENVEHLGSTHVLCGLMETGKDTPGAPGHMGPKGFRGLAEWHREHIFGISCLGLTSNSSPFWLCDFKKPHNQIFPIFSN